MLIFLALVLSRVVLLFDVLVDDAQWCPVDGACEVGARPGFVGLVVVAVQVGELVAYPPAGHALEAVDQLGDGDLGWEVDEQVDVVVLGR
jgi:hypothetical protein